MENGEGNTPALNNEFSLPTECTDDLWHRSWISEGRLESSLIEVVRIWNPSSDMRPHVPEHSGNSRETEVSDVRGKHLTMCSADGKQKQVSADWFRVVAESRDWPDAVNVSMKCENVGAGQVHIKFRSEIEGGKLGSVSHTYVSRTCNLSSNKGRTHCSSSVFSYISAAVLLCRKAQP